MSKRSEEAALKAYPIISVDARGERCEGSTAPTGNDFLRGIFQQGYELAEKDLGWHSVEESLPPVDEEVIVLKDILVEGGLKVGFGMITFGHLVDTERCIDYNGWNIPGVKFWMPMPKIPEE